MHAIVEYARNYMSWKKQKNNVRTKDRSSMWILLSTVIFPHFNSDDVEKQNLIINWKVKEKSE